VDLLPGEAEVRGLLALVLAQHARRAARVVGGELVTLEEQDRSRWDRAAIAEAEALAPPPRGPYAVQAHLALVHDRTERAEDTDWRRIVALYDRLPPTPVVALNRAVAVGMAEGPDAGLRAVAAVAAEPVLRDSHLLPAVRADLLQRAGRTDEARTELARAAALAPTEAERHQLSGRGARLA
jgi:RNA polymerase sigma-70 factor, ECF subfamily